MNSAYQRMSGRRFDRPRERETRRRRWTEGSGERKSFGKGEMAKGEKTNIDRRVRIDIDSDADSIYNISSCKQGVK